MNEWTALMDQISRLRTFVEQARGRVCRISWYRGPEDDSSRPRALRVTAGASMWVAADGLDDTIKIGTDAPAQLVEDSAVESAAPRGLPDLDGRSIVSAWLMTNQQGYVDGLQLCFSDANDALVIAQSIALSSTLSLATSYIPASCSSAPTSPDQTSTRGAGGDEFARLLGTLKDAVDDLAPLSDVLYRRPRSSPSGVVFAFGDRALDVRFIDGKVQAAIVAEVPRDCESVANDKTWQTSRNGPASSPPTRPHPGVPSSWKSNRSCSQTSSLLTQFGMTT